MNIVIVGAGSIGSYIAELLSKENHNVILLDRDPKKLEEISWQLDIATKECLATDWQTLDSLMDLSPDLFVALTDNDHTNLVACTIAKNLGYPRTIARVRDSRFLNQTRLDFARLFDVDHFISPELLVANEIFKYINSSGSLKIETFAHGAVQLRTIVIPDHWKNSSTPLSKLELPNGVIIGLISRGEAEDNQIIFPHGNDTIQPNDEVTLIGEAEPMEVIHRYFGIKQQSIKSVVIMGGSLTAIHLAKILEKRKMHLKLIEKEPSKCSLLSELLTQTTVIHHNGTDLEFLKAEKVGFADLFIACTRSDETNILSTLLAQEVGCKNILAQLTNPSYTSIVSHLKINHVTSPRNMAANRILSLLSGSVCSVAALYENRAEIIEITVSMRSKAAGIPVSELGPLLPKDFLIAIIENRGRIMVARGDRIISPGDTVIIVSNPSHFYELDKIF